MNWITAIVLAAISAASLAGTIAHAPECRDRPPVMAGNMVMAGCPTR